jgi:hypothetical protein
MRRKLELSLSALLIAALALMGSAEAKRLAPRASKKSLQLKKRGTVVKKLVRRLALRPLAPRARMRRTLPRPDHRAGIRQITGRDLAVGQTEFKFRSPADPFIDQLPDGSVHVYGTFENYLEFDSLDDFLRGARFRVVKIPAAESLANEASWDQLIHRWPDGSEVMYSGTMTPTEGRALPRWPADNWNRRIYAYTRDASGTWVRRPQPLFNRMEEGAQPTMLGHTYGHHFKTVVRRGVSETWLFHEEIVAEGPLKTEMFARRMLDPFTASHEKVKILGTEWKGHPIGKRANGESLVEGPRPFAARLAGEDYSFVSFSSGDFNSDNYDLHFAWRKGDGIGQHTPYLDRSGGQVKLRGFAADIKRRYGLSWVGRAHVIQDRGGKFWAVFHGVDKAIRPEVDYSQPNGDLGRFQRNIYAVPMEIRLGKNGVPSIELRPDPR